MKLQAELDSVVEKMEEVKEQIEIHAERLKKDGRYKDIETHLARDVLRAVVGPYTISKWYTQYNCNDDHINTLAKKALNRVYPISKMDLFGEPSKKEQE